MAGLGWFHPPVLPEVSPALSDSGPLTGYWAVLDRLVEEESVTEEAAPSSESVSVWPLVSTFREAPASDHSLPGALMASLQTKQRCQRGRARYGSRKGIGKARCKKEA